MKLIDILVRDLHKFGGWPVGAAECHRFVDEANIDFYDKGGNWPEDCFLKYGPFAQEAVREREVPGASESVTREQYESALAATQPQWDGEGLPPVGCECELFDCEEWNPVRIKFLGEKYVVTQRLDLGYEVVYCLVEHPDKFRPIRSEADKKRDAAIEKITNVMGVFAVKEVGKDIYDAIAAGKIPGIRIE